MPQTYTQLKDRLKTKLDGISKIQQVSGFPQLNFTGYPAAVVVPSDQDSDYETTTENERVYAFIISVFQETKKTGLETALDALYDLIDDISDSFDQDQQLTDDGTLSLASRYTIIAVEPVRGPWELLEDANLLKVDLMIRIRVSVDIT